MVVVIAAADATGLAHCHHGSTTMSRYRHHGVQKTHRKEETKTSQTPPTRHSVGCALPFSDETQCVAMYVSLVCLPRVKYVVSSDGIGSHPTRSDRWNPFDLLDLVKGSCMSHKYVGTYVGWSEIQTTG